MDGVEGRNSSLRKGFYLQIILNKILTKLQQCHPFASYLCNIMYFMAMISLKILQNWVQDEIQSRFVEYSSIAPTHILVL